MYCHLMNVQDRLEILDLGELFLLLTIVKIFQLFDRIKRKLNMKLLNNRIFKEFDDKHLVSYKMKFIYLLI